MNKSRFKRPRLAKLIRFVVSKLVIYLQYEETKYWRKREFAESWSQVYYNYMKRMIDGDFEDPFVWDLGTLLNSEQYLKMSRWHNRRLTVWRHLGKIGFESRYWLVITPAIRRKTLLKEWDKWNELYESVRDSIRRGREIIEASTDYEELPNNENGE